VHRNGERARRNARCQEAEPALVTLDLFPYAGELALDAQNLVELSGSVGEQADQALLETARIADPRGDIDELLAASHIISLHCNLHPGNLGLLNRDAFARMRQRPLIINVARGGLIVEMDLVRALDEGQVSGAALDVLAQDSPDLRRHPLAGRADVLLTPHVAFYSEAALADLRRISAQNIAAFLQGRAVDVFRLVSEREVASSA